MTTSKNQNLDDYYRAQLDAEEDAATSNEEVTSRNSSFSLIPPMAGKSHVLLDDETTQPVLHRTESTASTTEMIEIVDLDSGEISQETVTHLSMDPETRRINLGGAEITEAEFQEALKAVLVDRGEAAPEAPREKAPKIMKVQLCAADEADNAVLDFSDVVMDMIADVDIGIEVEHVTLDISESILGANYIDQEGRCRGGFILQTAEEAWMLNGSVCLNALSSMLITIVRDHHTARYEALTADSESSQQEFAEAVRKIQAHAGVPEAKADDDDKSSTGDE